jgi:hypothetical protein
LLLVEQADMQQVVPELSAEPSFVLGDGTIGDGATQLTKPIGAAFITAHPDWLVTSEWSGHRIKISNIRTGALVCKFGGRSNGKRQFDCAVAVAVTSGSPFVLVTDIGSHRAQVLQQVIGADGNSAHLEFVRSLGSRRDPSGVLALRRLLLLPHKRPSALPRCITPSTTLDLICGAADDSASGQFGYYTLPADAWC